MRFFKKAQSWELHFWFLFPQKLLLRLWSLSWSVVSEEYLILLFCSYIWMQGSLYHCLGFSSKFLVLLFQPQLLSPSPSHTLSRNIRIERDFLLQWFIQVLQAAVRWSQENFLFSAFRNTFPSCAQPAWSLWGREREKEGSDVRSEVEEHTSRGQFVEEQEKGI